MAFRGAWAVVVVGSCFLAGLAPLSAQTSQPTGIAAPQVARVVEGLRSPDSAKQLAALRELTSDKSITLLDETVIDGLRKLAAEAAPKVQRELATEIGRTFIWSARDKQDPGAIALMCYIATASQDRDARYNAVYFGLSTVREQADDTLAALMAAGAKMVDYDGNLHGRIAWGIKRTPAEKIAAACERYWTPAKIDADPRAAWVIYQTFKEATGKEPPQTERFAAVKEKVDAIVAERRAAHANMPELTRELVGGDSTRRTAVMQRIYKTPYLLSDLDDSLLDAFIVAAGDPDWRVRSEVARLTGGPWVWRAEKPHPKAIELALRLRADSQADVRGFAVYFGLSTIAEPSDVVIKALLDSALGEFRTNDIGRISWGLRRVKAERLLPFVEPYFEKAKDDPATAAAALKLYTDATGSPPPRTPELQQANVEAKAYASAFKELHAHLGRVYPAFEIKKIDWKKVGEELLPKADEVKDDRAFGLLCLELVARLEDSHAQLLPGTAPIPTIDFPKYDPGFACLIDDRDRRVVYHVDKDSPADKAGVKIGMAVVSVNGTPAADAMKAWMERQRTYVGYSSERYLRYDAAKGFVRQMKRGEIVKLEMEDPAGAKRQFELPATLEVRYLPRLPVPIDGIDDSGAVEARRLDDGIGYIYVRRIRGELPDSLDAALKQLGKINGLIIDVRGNSGGGFDADRTFRNFDPADEEEPNRPRYTGPIALLIDERCISAGEGWSSWFVTKRRARTFGTTTAGASSRKAEYTLTDGLFKMIVPVKAYTGFLDRPIERRGLEPDVPVRVTAADLAACRDTVLEAAKGWLREQAKP